MVGLAIGDGLTGAIDVGRFVGATEGFVLGVKDVGTMVVGGRKD